MNQQHSPELLQLDQQLFDLVKDIDILDALNPLNYQLQKALFFESRYTQEPQFSYRDHNIDVFRLKRSLFNLPLEQIEDADLAQLYVDVIDAYVDKIDQFKSVGTSDFLYDSLRYYGEPSEKDKRNAYFILHLPDMDKVKKAPRLKPEGFADLLRDFAAKEGYSCQFSLVGAMIAKALVSGTTVKINSTASIDRTEAMALAHHELGVHLVTTLNGRAQPLRVMSLGCPVNTMTQEGLAILSEYMAGHMTLPRLRILALRVLAVESLLKEKSFKNTFLMLKEQYQVDDEQAFTITARVYRGGGFTKDYVYLQGFHRMLNAYETEENFNHLLIGKSSIEYLPLLTRLIDKGWLSAPQLITPAIREPASHNAIEQFVAHAIK